MVCLEWSALFYDVCLSCTCSQRPEGYLWDAKHTYEALLCSMSVQVLLCVPVLL